jgi:quercetin dioxygenase-like cupin family protein
MSGLGIAAALGIFAIGTALSTQRTAYQLSTVGPQANLQEGARVMSSERAFKAILPEEIEWKPFPAFPPSVRLAVVVGRPTEKELYAIRVKVPGDVKMMPHRHPEDRIYTVVSGVFYIGLGDRFDADALKAYSPGAVIVLPGNTSHFHWAKSGEYVTQVTAMGPLGIEYVHAEDDPRSRKELNR